MENERDWYPYENALTIGRRGPAGGRVQQDEEFGDLDEEEDADARVTLESLADGKFAVTANLYGGWLQETAIFSEEAAAQKALETAKEELARLAEMIPDEEERDLVAQVAALNSAIATFTTQFGGAPLL